MDFHRSLADAEISGDLFA
jgi:hypothetical protein